MRAKLAIVATGLLLPGAAAAGKPFRPAKLYAALFDPDHTWRYTLTTTTAGKTDTVVVTCKVDTVGHFRGGVTSRIECDHTLGLPDTTGPLVGNWAATRRGLYALSDDLPPDGTAPHLDPDDLQLRPSPRVYDHTEELEEGSITLSIHHDHGAWCLENSSTAMGTDDSSSLCFAAGSVVRGDSKNDADTPEDAAFTLAP